jgi:hypothetical protein
MNKKRTFFISLIFLVTIACVLPGLSSTPAAPIFAPTVDTGAIETRVAGTVSAVLVLTKQAQPTATATFTATPPPISTTPAPTGTPTPTANPSQSTLTQQADGSTLFVDERAGYKVTIPAEWLAVRVDQPEYLDAFSLEEAANANIQQSLLNVQAEDPNTFRLFAVDTQPMHIQNDFVTDMRFVLDEQKKIDLGSMTDLLAIAEKIPASAEAFRFGVTSTEIITSPSGVQFGVIEAESSFTNPDGAEVPIYQKQVFFNTKSGTQSIIFTTVTDLKQTIMPVFDTMLETISPIEK